MKKIISLFLVLVIAVSCAVPVLAAKQTPLIIVTGMNTLPLYENYGEPNQKQVFSPQGDVITDAVKSIILPTLKVLFDRDWVSFSDALAPAVNSVFEPIVCVDGESKHDVKTIELADSCDKIEIDLITEAGRALALNAMKRYGAENVYIFTYDWRLDLYETAEKLDDLVAKVKSERHTQKVDLASISMGGAVTTAYFSRFGYNDVENVTGISSAFTGVGIVGDLFTGALSIDRKAVLRYLCQQFTDSPVLMSTLTALTVTMNFAGVFNSIFNFSEELFEETYDAMYEKVIRDTFGSLPGIWALVSADKFAAAKSFMFNEKSSKKLIAVVDRYYEEVSSRTKEIYDAALEAGVKIAFLSNYGRQGVPVYDGQNNQHDCVIDTVLTSGGASCADIGKKLGRGYVQKNTSCGHSHISPDNVVDASTCFYPEYTWFIKNFKHVGFETEGNSTELVFLLGEATAQMDVFSFENYPQFLVYSYNRHSLTPLKKYSPTANFIFN